MLAMPAKTVHHSVLLCRIGMMLLLLVVTACLWPGLQAPLFQDDFPQLEYVRGFSNGFQVLGIDAFYFFRPVKNLIFLLAAPWDQELPMWHAVGLVAYWAATLGVYRIARVCLDSRGSALIAAAIWALSPACVSTALWLSCANISLGIAFAGGWFHFHERWARGAGWGWLAGCLACQLLCLVSYEALIVLSALLFWRDFCQRRLQANRRMVAVYAAYAAVSVGFVILRYMVAAKALGVNDQHGAFAPGTAAWQLSVSAPWFLWRHFLMWLQPMGNLEILGSYLWLKSAPVGVLVASWVALIAAVSGALWLRRRLPEVSYGVVFFLLANVPAGNFLPGFNGPINDCYVAIPSIGLALACAALCQCLLRRIRSSEERWKPLAWVAFSLLLMWRVPVSAVQFRYWAGVWADPLRMALLMAESRPYQYQLKYYASLLMMGRGDWNKAEELASAALLDAPWSYLPRITLARVALGRGELVHAAEQFQTAIDNPRIKPGLRAALRVERAEALAGDTALRAQAMDAARTLLAAPDTPAAHHLRMVLLLSRLYVESGEYVRARATLKRGLAMHPVSPEIANELESLDKEEK